MQINYLFIWRYKGIFQAGYISHAGAYNRTKIVVDFAKRRTPNFLSFSGEQIINFFFVKSEYIFASLYLHYSSWLM